MLGLLNLAGSQGAGVLGRAQALARNQQMAEAVQRLGEVETRLEHYGVKHYFDVDLADVRGMDYYTGITFKAYTAQNGFFHRQWRALRQPDRPFRPDQPAVGCAFYLDRILLARQRQSGPPAEPHPTCSSIPAPAAATCNSPTKPALPGLVAAIALGPEPAEPAIPNLRCTCDGSRYLDRRRRLRGSHDTLVRRTLTYPIPYRLCSPSPCPKVA